MNGDPFADGLTLPKKRVSQAESRRAWERFFLGWSEIALEEPTVVSKRFPAAEASSKNASPPLPGESSRRWVELNSIFSTTGIAQPSGILAATRECRYP